MCGRTACTLAPDELSRACRYRTRGGLRRIPRWRDGDPDRYRPSYNKSPQTTSPVLLSQKHFDQGAPADHCVLASMRWGLVPSWFRENNPVKMKFSTSNCRSENILDKNTYKGALSRGQRCVVLADGFYEWQKEGKHKQPFFIYFPQTTEEDKPSSSSPPSSPPPANDSHTQDKGEPEEWTGWRPLTMAGVFDCWTPPEGGDPLYTYSIITVEASPTLQTIHHRMPAVLDGEEEVRQWLDFGTVTSRDAVKLLQPKNSLSFHPVSTLVNNSHNDSPRCLQPGSTKKPTPTGSSQLMMNWLKRKEEPKSESGASKKPRTQ